MNNNYILDKELLEKRLKALADTPYSGEINFGAMCYAPRRIPIVKYECEICGKITERNQDDLDFLKKAKEIVTELKTAGYDVLLDEREFCKYCPGEKSRPPNLIFIIRFNQNENYHKARARSSYDFKLVQLFLEGGDHFSGDYDETVTLHDNIDQIYKMTGLGVDMIVQWLHERKKKGKAKNEHC